MSNKHYNTKKSFAERIGGAVKKHKRVAPKFNPVTPKRKKSGY